MSHEDNVIKLEKYLVKESGIPTFGTEGIIEHIMPKNLLLKRAIAFGADFMTIMLLKITVYSGHIIFVNQFLAPLDDRIKLKLITHPTALDVGIFLLIYSSYFLYTNFVLEGKTLGKMAMGLRVINENFVRDQQRLEYEINLSDSIKRTLGYLVCYLSFGTFFIFHFASEDKRGFPDYLSNTRTVDDNWLKQTLEQKKYAKEAVYIDIKSLAA